jgi:WhiB family transcriptional regulator, redox-sensing transcriptional regulator
MPLFTPRSGGWVSRAACGRAAGLFDADTEASVRSEAISICRASCPVLDECRQWAQVTRYTGVAGGAFYRAGARSTSSSRAASRSTRTGTKSRSGA